MFETMLARIKRECQIASLIFALVFIAAAAYTLHTSGWRDVQLLVLFFGVVALIPWSDYWLFKSQVKKLSHVSYASKVEETVRRHHPEWF